MAGPNRGRQSNPFSIQQRPTRLVSRHPDRSSYPSDKHHLEPGLERRWRAARVLCVDWMRMGLLSCAVLRRHPPEMVVVLHEGRGYYHADGCAVVQAIELGNRVLRQPEEVDDETDPGPFTLATSC